MNVLKRKHNANMCKQKANRQHTQIKYTKAVVPFYISVWEKYEISIMLIAHRTATVEKLFESCSNDLEKLALCIACIKRMDFAILLANFLCEKPLSEAHI